MAAKKKTPAKPKGKGAAKKGRSGVGKAVDFVRSKRFAHIRGAVYIMFALFLVIALVGYYATQGRGGWLGSVGLGLAEFFATHLFGVASIGFALLFFVYGMRLFDVVVMPWWSALGSTVFWMLWTSMLLGYIGVAWVDMAGFEAFAGIGLRLARPLDVWLSWWTLVLLLFVAGLFLVLVHKMRLPKVELPKMDLRKALNTIEEAVTDKEEQPSVTVAPEVSEMTAQKDNPKETGRKAAVEDPGVDDPFDEEARALFNQNRDGQQEAHDEELHDDGPQEGEAHEDMPVDNEVPFSIDDEFERVMAKARGEQPEAGTESDGVKFVFDDSALSDQEGGDESPQDDEPVDPETGEPLDPDDYRQHYGFDEPYDPHLDLKEFQMPTVDLLDDNEAGNVRVTKEELMANKDRIVETLSNYGIEITEITATIGPTVTLYRIKPGKGVRISKIKGLEDDIALSLAALGIRIIAPIPGESNVGIEVPNAKPQIVGMKTMLESDAFRNAKMELPLAFGKTISNEPFVTDLAKMPHLLMAGATGTGKSVGLNAVLASLLYKKHPSELKLVLVDPKKVEFSLYNSLIRHYLAKMPDEEEAVITDTKKVVRTLNSLCIEMDTRYDLLKQAKVRKITEYNEKFCKRMLNPEHGHRYLPYIVVVIDEFGDLIMTAGKEVELPIARLAQLARAVGIHLIIATQRPTTNIITGTIKANFPARVAFRVTSGIDSKTILDTGGAQQLIGRGDMLISLAGKDMVRLQCALIDTPEIERLVKFIGDQRGYPDGFELPEYLDENEEPNKEFDAKSKDEFFNDAARLVVSSQFGSTSLLQRKLQLGYNRAGRIIDQLEAAGIVGPSNGSKPRDVLIHDEVSLEELLKTL